MLSKKIDKRLVVQPEVCSMNGQDGRCMDQDAVFYAFLCGKCDNVHLVFTANNMPFQWNMQLSPETAEKLGNLLINPQVPQVRHD